MSPLFLSKIATCTFAAIFILFCFWMGGLWAMLGLSLSANAAFIWILFENKGVTIP